MNETHYVYQQPTLDFVTAAAQTCLLMEHAGEMEREEMQEQLLRLLPLLYLRTRMLGETELLMDGEMQQFVQEEDYNFVRLGIQQQLGSDDTYLSVLTDNSLYTDEPCTASISEDLADIYQEPEEHGRQFPDRPGGGDERCGL